MRIFLQNNNAVASKKIWVETLETRQNGEFFKILRMKLFFERGCSYQICRTGNAQLINLYVKSLFHYHLGYDSLLTY